MIHEDAAPDSSPKPQEIPPHILYPTDQELKQALKRDDVLAVPDLFKEVELIDVIDCSIDYLWELFFATDARFSFAQFQKEEMSTTKN